MDWLGKQKWWLLLNGTAVIVLVIVVTQGSLEMSYAADTFDPMLASGKWALRFLLLSLAMTPVNTYLGWRGALRLRKPAGLWAFGFAVVHVAYYFYEHRLTISFWRFEQLFIVLGLLGFVILLAMAATSNQWAMRQLKKNWKRLHRLVYLAGILLAFHAMLATTASKRIFLRDPDVLPELIFYFLLLIILLAVRIPLVWRIWRGVKQKRPFRLSPD